VSSVESGIRVIVNPATRPPSIAGTRVVSARIRPDSSPRRRSISRRSMARARDPAAAAASAGGGAGATAWAAALRRTTTGVPSKSTVTRSASMAATRPPKAVSPTPTTRVRPAEWRTAVRRSRRGERMMPSAERSEGADATTNASTRASGINPIIGATLDDNRRHGAPDALPPPAPPTLRDRRRRAADFLAWTWRGRILLASLLVFFLTRAGLAMPCGLDVFANIALFFYAAGGTFRLGASSSAACSGGSAPS
jgi:hypothetical protein